MTKWVDLNSRIFYVMITVEKSIRREYSKLIEEVKNYTKNEHSSKPRKTYVEALVGGISKVHPK